MLSLQSTVFVDGITSREISDFLLDCTDESYRRWWPGTHCRLHVLQHGQSGHVGDVVFMDEYIGRRHVRLTGAVVEAPRGEAAEKKIVWRLRKWVDLPVRLTLELSDHDGGVEVRHTIRAGFQGIGRVLDPAFRLYFTAEFAAAMDAHVRTEFPLLRDRLTERSPGPR